MFRVFFYLGDTSQINKDIFMIGDSKTASFGTINERFVTMKYLFSELPTRFAGSGWTADTVAAGIDANLASVTDTPDYILINLGANDVGALPTEAAWKADINYILSALNTKFPSTPCYLMKVWRRGELTDCNSIAGWIDDIVAANPLANVGADERVFLENGDDGVTFTTDGIHPTAAGYKLTGDKWIEAIGLLP